MSTRHLDELLLSLNDVERSQISSGNNFNYMDLDFINNPIPEMPTWDFFKDGDIAVTKNNRFSYVPAHTHSFIELNYMYSGHCTQYVNDERIDLHQGSLLLVDKDIVQRIDYTGRDDLLVNILIKSDAYISGLLSLIPESLNVVSQLIYNAGNDESLHNNFILFNLAKNDIATSLIDALISKGLERHVTQPQHHQSMRLILSALIIELKASVEKSLINFSDSNTDTVLPIVKYINEHYATATLDSVSEKFGYNRNYLSNKLKSGTGKSFQELIDRRRLSVAENLMIKTNLTNTAISDQVGYKNTTSLFRLFKHYLNTTPAKYREKVHPKFTDISLHHLPTQADLPQ
jgi:AraC-like DNA-binding protein